MLYAVHGVADRDPNELVLVFCETFDDVLQFMESLPGTYDIQSVIGVKYSDIELVVTVYDKHCVVCGEGIRVGEEPHTDEESGEDCHDRCCSTCNEGGV